MFMTCFVLSFVFNVSGLVSAVCHRLDLTLVPTSIVLDLFFFLFCRHGNICLVMPGCSVIFLHIKSFSPELLFSQNLF